MIDAVNRKRIDVTRTTAAESSPRWALGETHVTFVRDNNLFIVPVESVEAGGLVQLTDVMPRRADPRVTDSQKFLKEEEAKLLDWVEEEAARRKRREALDRARALPKFELAERQTIADAAMTRRSQVRLPGDERARAVARVAGAALRERVGLHRGDQRAHEGRRHAGSTAARDPQSRNRRGVSGPDWRG